MLLLFLAATPISQKYTTTNCHIDMKNIKMKIKWKEKSPSGRVHYKDDEYVFLLMEELTE